MEKLVVNKMDSKKDGAINLFLKFLSPDLDRFLNE
jgi:hypothetical protein